MAIDNIQRVVVLMLENRSFDHMLGDLKGVDGALSSRLNMDASGKAYAQTRRDNFVLPLSLDPKHEFANVQVQLGPPAHVRAMSGFVLDAQATASKTSGYAAASPATRQAAVQSVMDHFSDGALPALHALANQFAVCDKWFASVPGPTWPNRFFAMMGSCHGQLQMPTGPLDAVVTVRSIAAQLGKDSIFSVLTGVSHQIYSDYLVPLSILLKGSGERASLAQFDSDVDSGTLPQFSWVEPDYSSNLKHANSQHPPENVLRGDNLVARIYNKLRGSALWDETLLVILHDEHGGFYDHVPPAPTISADDSPSHPSFDYATTGVRVPCVLVSPWIERGVLSAVYDHTSLLAFLCDHFKLPQQRSLLGRRTAAAGHFGSALVWSDQKRIDVPGPLAISAISQQTGEEASADLDEMLPKLLSGLGAHAQAQAHTTAGANVLLAKSLSPHATAAANDIRIAQAWDQGGTLDAAAVKRLVEQVKQTFAR